MLEIRILVLETKFALIFTQMSFFLDSSMSIHMSCNMHVFVFQQFASTC